MISFNSRIVVLRGHGGALPRSIRVHSATFWRPSWTLFHHAPATTRAVCPVPISVIEPAILAVLMTASAFAQVPLPRITPALRRAVSIAAVASRAEEEQLPAAGKRADDEAK
jgi:hypothetical protein